MRLTCIERYWLVVDSVYIIQDPDPDLIYKSVPYLLKSPTTAKSVF